jgi:hypothetical protein
MPGIKIEVKAESSETLKSSFPQTLHRKAIKRNSLVLPPLAGALPGFEYLI